jgi:hypothetical protein
MTNKEIRKLAEEKISQGKTRQQTFDEIKEETKQSSEKVAKIIRFIPTLDSRERYKIANTILGIILLLTVFLKILAGIPIILQFGKIELLPLIKNEMPIE